LLYSTTLRQMSNSLASFDGAMVYGAPASLSGVHYNAYAYAPKEPCRASRWAAPGGARVG
jgi:hypothetical protein